MKTTAALNLGIILALIILLQKLKVFDVLDFLQSRIGKPSFDRPKTLMDEIIPPEIGGFVDVSEFEKGGSRPEDISLGKRIIEKVSKPYGALISKWARFVDLPPALITSLIWRESAGNPNAVGRALEIGLTQVTLPALQDVNRSFGLQYEGVSILRNPEVAIQVGAMFLRLKIDEMGSISEGLRAYNCGATGAKRNHECGKEYATNIFKNAQTLQKLGV